MLAEMFQNDQTVKIGLWLIMTFKDLVAPKGAVLYFIGPKGYKVVWQFGC